METRVYDSAGSHHACERRGKNTPSATSRIFKAPPFSSFRWDHATMVISVDSKEISCTRNYLREQFPGFVDLQVIRE